jgi:N,N-dimethylformamidase
MLVGYVSDEDYVAVADVVVELIVGDTSVDARSRASGAVYADVPEGRYEVVLSRAGYGPKRTTADVRAGSPVQFRLMSDRLLGYSWPKWVVAGGDAQVRVTSPRPYRVELWRYGWQKELVAPLGYDSHAPRATAQLTPDGDYSGRGVDWSDPLVARAPERSGLYFFHVQDDANGFTSFPWIVTPSAPSAPVAVLTSSATWNAYNNFGGRSNYIDPVGLPPIPRVNRRQELERYTHPDLEAWREIDYAPLSFDRPEPANAVPLDEQITDPVRGREACGLVSAEWRLLGWLEHQGFDYDLYADVQLHFGDIDLDAYRVLVLNTHPEYWSTTMFDAVRDWVQRGGRLMYLGGNGLNCPIELPNPDTMIVRNGDGLVLNADRPRLQSRLGMQHVPEATLLGVGFTRDGMFTAAPYRVVDADHWAFDGTGLREGDLFGVDSLHTRCPGGASGHEMDKITPSSPAGVRLLAKGSNADKAGAEMTYYELVGGGAVFSVGSINYCCSLPVDDAVSQVTGNVLRRLLT